jgi:hypothetical protein
MKRAYAREIAKPGHVCLKPGSVLLVAVRASNQEVGRKKDTKSKTKSAKTSMARALEMNQKYIILARSNSRQALDFEYMRRLKTNLLNQINVEMKHK